MSLIQSVRSMFSLRPPPTKYVRSSGAICYEIALRHEPDEFIASLVGSDLFWSWTYWPWNGPPSTQTARYKTVTEDTQRFRSVLLETRGDESCANSVAVFGWNSPAAVDASRQQSLDEIRLLASGEPGLIEIVIVAPNDQLRSYVFTRESMTPSVRRQFAAWSVNLDEYETRPYSRLHTMTLERFLESEIRS